MTAVPTFRVLHACTLSDKTGAAKRVRPGDLLEGEHWERFVRKGVIEAQVPPAAVSPQPKEMVVGGTAPAPSGLPTAPAASTTALFSTPAEPAGEEAPAAPVTPPTAVAVNGVATAPVEGPADVETPPVLLRSVDEMSKGELLMLAEKHKIVGADKMPVRELRKALERAVS